jgi:hypothetical protein
MRCKYGDYCGDPDCDRCYPLESDWDDLANQADLKNDEEMLEELFGD